MPIVADIDVMLARRKMAVGALAERIGITPADPSVLKNGRAKAVRLYTLDALCEAMDCQPGAAWDLLRWVPQQLQDDESAGAASVAEAAAEPIGGR